MSEINSRAKGREGGCFICAHGYKMIWYSEPSPLGCIVAIGAAKRAEIMFYSQERAARAGGRAERREFRLHTFLRCTCLCSFIGPNQTHDWRRFQMRYDFWPTFMKHTCVRALYFYSLLVPHNNAPHKQNASCITSRWWIAFPYEDHVWLTSQRRSVSVTDSGTETLIFLTQRHRIRVPYDLLLVRWEIIFSFHFNFIFFKIVLNDFEYKWMQN